MSLGPPWLYQVVDLPAVLLNHGVQLVVIALNAVQRGCLVADRSVWLWDPPRRVSNEDKAGSGVSGPRGG